MAINDNHTDGQLAVRTDTKLQRPRKYQVVALNDDWTPMEFVVFVLAKVFNLNAQNAEAHMLEIHKTGRTQFGPYPKDVAETKVGEILGLSRRAQHPFLAKAELAP